MGARRICTTSRLLFGAAALSVLLSAREGAASGGDVIPGSRYVSGRGAAMGDAFIPFADDGASALFYNPAAIGRLEGFSFEPINLQIQTNQVLVKQAGTEIYNFSTLSGYLPKLRENPYTQPGASASFLPNLSFRGFAAGMLMQSRIRATTDGTNVTYRSVYQLIPAAGVGIRLASGVLRLGYVLQWVNQASGTITVPVNTTPLGWNQRLSEGAGFSHNFGLALTLPYIYQPAINVVARNIGGVSYSGSSLYGFAQNPVGDQPDDEMSLDAALSFVTKTGRGSELKTALQYRDALNASNMPATARAAVGMELSLQERFMLRAGMASGYPSAGIGIRTERSEVNLSWFSEEIGTKFRDQRDIRYVFHYKISAF